MANRDLQDLALAGVCWELVDVPMTVTAAVSAGAAPDAAANTAAPAPGMGVAEIDAGLTMRRTPTQIVPPIAPVQPMSPDTAAAMATRPGDMDALCRMIAEFNHPLRAGATNVVGPRAGNASGLAIVTDIPGPDDDACGEILRGGAGAMLDKMLLAIGLRRADVSMTPLVFWRTPGGRAPTRAELDLARPFVMRALDLMAPRVVLTLGTLAAAEMAGATLPRDHGVTVTRDGREIVPIFHPNYLMLKPAAKRDAWTALQKIEKMLKSA